MKTDKATGNTFVVPLSIWFFLMGGYQLVAALVSGKLTFRSEQSYLWTLWLQTAGILTLETGVLTVASLWLFCRKLPRRLGAVSGAVLGLVIPPVLGLCTGWLGENLGHRLLFQWNVLQGWIWGLGLALPNAVVSLILAIKIGRGHQAGRAT